MERRKAERTKQRLTCEIVVANRCHPGIVLDLSPIGLFVQTSASPPPGESVRVRLRRPGGIEVEVQAAVARRYQVPHRLASVARGGIGLSVESAPEEYMKLIGSAWRVEEPTPSETTGGTSQPEPREGSTYRIRAKQTTGPRSRALRVTAESEEEAKAVASSMLDEGWEILTVDPVQA